MQHAVKCVVVALEGVTVERVSRIGGLFLRADDPARLGRWYADHLGVEVAPEPADPMPGFSMFTAMPAAGTASTFEVPDLDAMVSQLRDAGIDVDVDPAGNRGGRFASLRDPGCSASQTTGNCSRMGRWGRPTT